MRQAKVLLTLCLLAVCAVAAEPAIAIRNARIVTMNGPAVEKGTVVVRGGLIEAVGRDVAPPGEAWGIEGEGLTV
jgi:imidazolonepropionase-like amidohydrolase